MKVEVAWDFINDRPIYLQVMNIMKGRIVSGYYKPGDKVESVRILAMEAAVNPNTMQKALSELEREGLMCSNRTNGRYVTENEERIFLLKETIANENWEELLAGMKNLGWNNQQIKAFIEEKLTSLS